jgi:Zn-dependent protease
MVNLGFMLFNIIPIPPLDGSRVLYALAPDFIREFMKKIERHGFIVIYILLFFFGTLLSNYIYTGEDLVLGWFESFYSMIGL